MIRDRTAKTLLILSGTLLGLAAAGAALEGYLRWKGLMRLERFVQEKPTEHFAFVMNRDLHYKPSADSGLGWEINPERTPPRHMKRAKGHRCAGKPEAVLKNPATYRIITIGDSVTEFGYYQEFLEQRLNQAGLGRAFEVWNCGVGGYSLGQYHRFIQARALQFQPDMLVVGIELGDLMIHPVVFKTSQGFATFRNPARLASFPILESLYLRSAAYRYLLYAMGGRLSAEKEEPAPVEYLDRLADLASGPGPKLLFVVWPRYKSRYERWERLSHEKIVAGLKKRRVPFVDLHKTFADRDLRELRMSSEDFIHPSASAYKRLADDIFEAVARELPSGARH